MKKREYRIIFNNPFYYLEVKYRLWFITFWTAIDYSHDLGEMERVLVEKQK